MKNFILKTITIIAFVIWIITALALDSDVYFSQIIAANVISGAWIVSHLYINRYYYWREFNEECRR